MSENFKPYTLDEAKQLPSLTDEKRLAAMTDDELEAAALADPDNPPLTAEQLQTMKPLEEVMPWLAAKKRGRPVKEQVKEQVTVRLDSKVLAYFRASGEGWQTRLNDVLSEYVDKNEKVA